MIEAMQWGRPLLITMDIGQTSSIPYLGQPYRIEYPDGSIELKEYSLDGLLVKEIAKNGLVTQYSYDALGRVVRTENSIPTEIY